MHAPDPAPAPLVTVVVPTYNRADLLPATLDSVAAQTFRDWECIVVDDGSTDDTADVVARYAAADPRFRYVRQENSSASAARNRGLALARGRYVAFVDSDDLYTPDRLAWQVAALERDPSAVLAYGDTLHFRGADPSQGHLYMAHVDPKPSGDAFDALVCCSAIYAPLVRTEAIRRLGGFDSSLGSAEDWDAWLSLAKIGRIVYEPRLALRYRVHEGNKSGNTLRNYTCARRVVRKQLAGLPLRRRLRLYRATRRYFRTNGYVPRLLEDAERLEASRRWPAARPVWRALAWLDPRQLARPRVLAHVLWALLPTNAAPPWRGVLRRLRAPAHDGARTR